MFSTPEADEPAVALPKGAVPMPEAGKGAYIIMDFPAMSALEEAFGPSYWSICEHGFTGPSPLVISRALAVSLHGAEADGAPWGLSLREIGTRLYDSQVRALRGITLAEAIAAVEEAQQ
jgi:hypothetical protein